MLIKVFLFTILFMPLYLIAYVGPGSGLSAIGSFIALIAAILFGVIGFLWFPIKRLIKGNKKNIKSEEHQVIEENESESEK